MNERVTYQYAIVRFVPRVERGECLNVGVVLFCRPRRFLGMRWAVDADRCRALDSHAGLDEISAHLAGQSRVAEGDVAAGPMSGLDMSERFHWLSSPSSTIIQPSPIHTGLTHDPAATLERLFAALVLPPHH